MEATVSKGERTKEMILARAAEVFNRQGYFGARLDDITRATGLEKGGIYNHFASKQALFGAALERAITELFSSLKTDDGDLRARLIRFGLQLRARALSPESIKLQRVLIGEAPRFPELAAGFFRHCVLGSYTHMSDVFQKAMAAGRMRRDDPMEMARLFMEMLIGLDRWRMLYGGPAPKPGQEQAHVERAVDLFLRACAPPARMAAVSNK